MTYRQWPERCHLYVHLSLSIWPMCAKIHRMETVCTSVHESFCYALANWTMRLHLLAGKDHPELFATWVGCPSTTWTHGHFLYETTVNLTGASFLSFSYEYEHISKLNVLHLPQQRAGCHLVIIYKQKRLAVTSSYQPAGQQAKQVN
jgi:hypothetical protein